MKRSVVLSLFLCGLMFCIHADTYFQTVDEEGRPLPDVQVAMTWTIFDHGDIAGVANKVYTSDANGRFSVDDSCLVIDNLNSVRKEGYCLEDYLNPRLWHRLLYQRHKSTPEHPFRFTLRKTLAERALTTGVCGLDYGICVARRGERVEPFELGVVRTVDGKGFQDTDCFAQPLFDEAERRWMCAFWTTNALGGVLATTNRVFIAPATGYAQRVVVPLEMCHQPSFTLYAKTYNPQLYAMFWIYGFASARRDVRERRWRDDLYVTNDLPRADSPYVALEVEFNLINPFGERVMESDDVVLWEPEREAHPHLRLHRYPPRPDLPARRMVWENIWKSYKERAKVLGDLDALEMKRSKQKACERQGEKSEIMKKLDREIETLRQTIRTINRERKRLEQEAETLNLPSTPRTGK